MAKAIALVMLLALAGCQTSIGDFCDEVTSPGRFSDTVIEAMDEAEVNWVLHINRRHARCPQ